MNASIHTVDKTAATSPKHPAVCTVQSLPLATDTYKANYAREIVSLE